MMLRNAETKQHRMVQWPMSNELESMYNKVVTIYHEKLSCNLPWETEEDKDKYVIVVHFRADIWTRNTSKTKKKKF
jgi:hypothetical protein